MAFLICYVTNVSSTLTAGKVDPNHPPIVHPIDHDEMWYDFTERQAAKRIAENYQNDPALFVLSDREFADLCR